MAPNPDPTPAAGAQGPRGDLMERAVDLAIRLGRAWRALSWQQRRAAVAAFVLWVTLFLPWYQASVVQGSALRHGAAAASQSITGWGAFSIVQAGILILSLGLLFVLFLRAEGRAARLPGGDGWSITAAGGLSLLLVIIGLFSAPTPAVRGQYVVSTGLEWGIFAALLASAALLYTGSQVRRSGERRRPAPPDDRVVFDGRWREPGGGAEPHRVPEPHRAAQPDRTPDPARTPDPSHPPRPVPADPATGQVPAGERSPDPAPDTAQTQIAREAKSAPRGKTAPAPKTAAARSRWRPSESPAWSDRERPTGWLTAPPKHLQEEDGGDDEAPDGPGRQRDR